MKSQKKYYLSHPDKETRKFLTNFKISDPCLFYRNWKIKKNTKKQKKNAKYLHLRWWLPFFVNCKLIKIVEKPF